MNTPSHAIINLAILGRSQQPEFNLIIVLGGILPDLPIFGFYFWAKFITHLPGEKIWTEAYYQPAVQNLVSLFHSIPLALLGWLIAYRFGWEWAQLLCLSMVLHSLGDLPVHNHDAHQHFYPFSNYRLIGPLSYWDPKHYGSIVAFLEMGLVLLSTARVFPLVHSIVGKILLIAVNSFYITMYVYFYARFLVASS